MVIPGNEKANFQSISCKTQGTMTFGKTKSSSYRRQSMPPMVSEQSNSQKKQKMPPASSDEESGGSQESSLKTCTSEPSLTSRASPVSEKLSNIHIDKTKYISESSSQGKVTLPDPDQNVDPDEFLAQLVEALVGYRPKTRSTLSLDDNFFPQHISEDKIAAYDVELVAACRDNDVAKLKELSLSSRLDCCNRFGETLLHMSCRRGFQETVDYLLQDVQLSVRVRDDCGRTPFHDACWNPTPQLDICTQLLERDPALLLLTDNRGATPFQYARPQHWPTWRKFLLQHCAHLEALKEAENVFS